MHPKKWMTRRSDALLLGVLILASAPVLALTANEISCGPLRNAYGPFDYRDATPDKKQIVESCTSRARATGSRQNVRHPGR